jgi:HAD superfamily hydrolase (TIGR01509 family)
MRASAADRGSAAGRGQAVLKGAIFDLDGTLVDSEPLDAASDAAFLARFGVEAADSLSRGEFVGIGTRAFLSLVAERFPGSPFAAIPPEERVALKDEAYLDFSRGKLHPFFGTVSLAVELSRRGLALAVASGSSPGVIRAELEAIEVKGLFSFALSASEVPRGKPEPDIFLEAARRLGFPPESCLVVEDSGYGVVAAKRAGMLCLALPSGADRARPEFALADILSPGGAAALDLGPVLVALERRGLPVSR